MLQNPENIAWEEEVVQRVRRGMGFLEEKYGPDWPDMFTEEDMEALDLASGSCCVLGTINRKRTANRVYNFANECQELGLLPHGNESSKNGFIIRPSDQKFRAEYPTLTDAWRRAIKARKADR